MDLKGEKKGVELGAVIWVHFEAPMDPLSGIARQLAVFSNRVQYQGISRDAACIYPKAFYPDRFLISGAALAAAGTAVGLKKLDYDRIAHAGVLSAAFFAASFIHVNIGPSSVHLILNGLVGLMLGWVAVPVIMVALLLQAVMFQFGGITTLGVNTVVMALPAVGAHYLFGPLICKNGKIATVAAFACGFFAVLAASILMALSLAATEARFFNLALLVMGAHLPVMVVEGFITAFAVGFLRKVQPAMLSDCLTVSSP